MSKPVRTVYGDGVNDDTDALQAYISGQCDLVDTSGKTVHPFSGDGNGKTFLVSKTLRTGGWRSIMLLDGATLRYSTDPKKGTP